MNYIQLKDLPQLIARLASQSTVYVPNKQDERYFLSIWNNKNTDANSFFFNPFRTDLPLLKSLLFPPNSVAAHYSSDSGMLKPPQVTNEKKYTVFGIKECDLFGKKVLDRIFLEQDFIDTAYRSRIENTLLISSDCTEAKSTCYCTMLGLHPYSLEGYDLNMSPVQDGYIFESGSEKGEKIISDNKDLFHEAIIAHMTDREQKRQTLKNKIEQQNKSFETIHPRQQSIEKNIVAPMWHTASETCVECNACNYVCPTCYCFILHERKTGDGFERIKAWDSCFHAGYARMAGGLTPRLRLVERFKNHYYHKFDSYVTNYGFEACSGCGRCIEACMGKIDKREVLKNIEMYVQLK